MRWLQQWRSKLPALLAFGGGLDLRGPASTVHVIGDVYLDILAKVEQLPEWDSDTTIQRPINTLAGGSALNTAVQLSELLRTRRQREQARPFRRCVLHSRLGSDLYGQLVAQQIREAGVTLSAKREGGQGVCICLSGATDRSFVSYKGSVGELSGDDIDTSLLFGPATSHVHFSAYYDCVGLQSALPSLVARAKAERGATISIVPQCPDASGDWSGGLLELLPQIDVLICNSREAAAIAQRTYDGPRPTWAELDDAARTLLRTGVPLVVITLGGEGAVAVTDEQMYLH